MADKVHSSGCDERISANGWRLGAGQDAEQTRRKTVRTETIVSRLVACTVLAFSGGATARPIAKGRVR